MLQHIGIAAQQYQLIRERLRIEEPDLDERTLADTLEGLTDIHEIIAAIIRSALQDEAMVRGLKGRIEDMQSRCTRFEERAVMRRQIARDVMTQIDVRKIMAPDFTVSVRPGTPALELLDESSIPGDYFEPREPRLNRQALLAELKQGAVIAGVQLSNPEPVLSVRTK